MNLAELNFHPDLRELDPVECLLGFFERKFTSQLDFIFNNIVNPSDNLTGTKSETIVGSRGDDWLEGGEGRDRLIGRRGDDLLFGGRGNDKLIGGRGDDWLEGGEGRDRLIGGKGEDIFAIAPGSGLDTVKDFQAGKDKIGLKGGLTYFDLSITQDKNDVLIRNAETDEALLDVRNSKIEQFSKADFVLPIPDIERLVIFGDSYSDTDIADDSGNLFDLLNGIYPPSPPYFKGRFSNGPIWADILNSRFAPAEVEVRSLAVGGAQTGRDNNNEVDFNVDLPGVLDQIENFVDETNPAHITADDAFVVWAGGNDFFGVFQGAENPVEVISEAVGNIATAVTTLSGIGAETIVVPNLPDLGLLPLTDSAGVGFLATQATMAYNQALAGTISNLEHQLELDIIELDLFELTERIEANPEEFGFTNISDPLLGSSTAANPEQFLFWDEVHPTTQGHEIIADVFQATLVANIGANSIASL